MNKTNFENEITKLEFQLENDGSGFPPFDTEVLGATRLSQRQFRIESVPYFCYEASFGDVVEGRLNSSTGNFQFVRRITAAEMTTLRVVFEDWDSHMMLVEYLSDVSSCFFELAPSLCMAAISVSNAVQAFNTIGYLEQLEEQKAILEYELAFDGHKLYS